MVKKYAIAGTKTEKGAQKMYSSDYVWAKVLIYLEERLTPVIVSAWFDDAKVIDLTEDNLILYSPTEMRRDVITRRYAGHIEDALKEIFNSDAFPWGSRGSGRWRRVSIRSCWK